MKKTLRCLSAGLAFSVFCISVQGQSLSSSPTLSFTNATGFGDNIAQDGEGGSVAISDINIQIMPINSSGTKMALDPLEYHGADWSTPPIITYGGVNSFYGWSIKSVNNAKFSLVSLDVFDWGEWTGFPCRVQAFRNGVSVGFVSFNANTNNTMVHLTYPGVLTQIFVNVDEVRVYKASGADSWLGINNIKVFSPATALPVSGLSFSVDRKNKVNLLKWQTAEESDSKDFTVEHGLDGVNFSRLATVAAAGNSSSTQHYSYLHTDVTNGRHYYRIMQRDLDGKETYSKIVSVNYEEVGGQLSFYPNPVINGQISIMLDKADRVEVFNSAGQLLITKQLPPGTQQLQLSSLKHGYYTIRAGAKSANLVL